ncbi:hypothetical protein L1D14_23050 [Vibrio tubiashii]|uniref:hypothetical protein n=1 Tax=Vibrio tubiashii TaxID=29498 RepID=UPI001EFEE5AA|nr:hypothetical protein [Vibrio tubiashii]MCG9579083.1 hypothetical protein [Vibrio tubiashii]
MLIHSQTSVPLSKFFANTGKNCLNVIQLSYPSERNDLMFFDSFDEKVIWSYINYLAKKNSLQSYVFNQNDHAVLTTISDIKPYSVNLATERCGTSSWNLLPSRATVEKLAKEVTVCHYSEVIQTCPQLAESVELVRHNQNLSYNINVVFHPRADSVLLIDIEANHFYWEMPDGSAMASTSIGYALAQSFGCTLSPENHI